MEAIKYFKALSDKTRLRLLNLLIRHELNVNEITNILGMGQSRISRHLKILTDCGLLSQRRDGLWVFYRAAPEGEGREFINSMENILRKDQDLKIDLSRLEWVIEEFEKNKTKYFDAIAPDWDKLKKNIFGNFNITKEIVSKLDMYHTAADLGCGTGELLAALNNKADKIIGIDKSSKMLEEVKQRLPRGENKYDLRLGKIEHLPMKENEADLAVINMVLHHLPSPFNGIAEANRILKTGGTLIIADIKKHDNEDMRRIYGHRWLGFSDNEIDNWLFNAGFEIKISSQYNVENNMKINLYFAEKIQDIRNLNQINIKEIYYEHEDDKRDYRA